VAGVLVGVGNVAYYQALAIGGKAATAASLTALYPVTTVILALILLREKPHMVQFVGIAGSLAAIYLLTGAQAAADLTGWIGYAMVPIALWGGSALIMKIATADVSAELATCSFLAGFIPLGALLLIAAELSLSWTEPTQWALSAREYMFVTLLGASYGLGNLWLLAAYRNGGKASVVTPLTGLYPVVTIPLAILFFGESVGLREWGGIVAALGSGVALSIERKADVRV
jgi:uncharacterized membrane protein